jgi:hypothetical protein
MDRSLPLSVIGKVRVLAISLYNTIRNFTRPAICLFDFRFALFHTNTSADRHFLCRSYKLQRRLPVFRVYLLVSLQFCAIACFLLCVCVSCSQHQPSNVLSHHGVAYPLSDSKLRTTPCRQCFRW